MSGSSIDFESIDRLFHPRSIAVVGASDRPGNQGRMLLDAIEGCGFEGKMYAVHPRDKVSNWETYPKVSDIPGPVDHVIITVPAKIVAGIIADAGKKGARSAAIFSSGFSEWGTEEGKRLQEELIVAGRKSGVRLIGPNCMGFYCPSTGLSFRSDLPMLDGPLGLISQSGGVAITSVFMGAGRGMGFSKAISYGNEADLGAPEFLDYLALDPSIEVIILYIEGTDRGGELLDALKRAASRKPVFVLKGGSTPTGLRAVTSHTGALAGSGDMWEAMSRQAGAPMVHNMEELIDAAQASIMLPEPKGRRVGLLTISGGLGVFATDIVVNAGFEMPEYSSDMKNKLLEIINKPGTSLHNPLDMAVSFHRPWTYPVLIEALGTDPGIDVYIALLATDYITQRGKGGEEWAHNTIDSLLDAFKKLNKPVAFVFLQTVMNKVRLELEKKITGAGFPVFPTVERCVKALDRRMRVVG